MISKQIELVFANPTNIFHSLLCKSLSKALRPAKALLRVDQTGYFIRRCEKLEQTVDEIERHYQNIFLYESRRWLGRTYQPAQSVNLLTFSKYFQLAFHQNIYLSEQAALDEKLIGLKLQPTEALLSWFQVNTILEPGLAKQVTLSSLIENASIILHRVTSIDTLLPFINTHFKLFAELEKTRLALPYFPSIDTLVDFQRFFSISIHQHIKFLEPIKEEI